MDGRVPDSQYGKASDDLSNFVREMRERWDNRLVFPLTKLRERYLSGHLEICLFCRIGRKRVFIQFKRADDFGREETFRDNKLSIEARDNQDERVMLIHTVQLVDDGKWVVDWIRSLVRLQISDEFERGGVGDPLYVSVVTGLSLFVRRSEIDRESNCSLVVSPVIVTGEAPRDVIEAGTPVVSDLSGKHAESRRNDTILVGIDPLLRSVCLGVSDTRVGAALDESVDLDAEIEDILVGPF